MNKEEYLEYLCLDSILQGYVTTAYANTFCDDAECILLNRHMKINLKKLRERVIELQKKLLKDYEL